MSDRHVCRQALTLINARQTYLSGMSAVKFDRVNGLLILHMLHFRSEVVENKHVFLKNIYPPQATDNSIVIHRIFKLQ